VKHHGLESLLFLDYLRQALDFFAKSEAEGYSRGCPHFAGAAAGSPEEIRLLWEPPTSH